MPRLSPRLLGLARQQSQLLAQLLPACRDIPSARNELRWLKEFVDGSTTPPSRKKAQLSELCRKRAHGVPLQYLLGTQPFGPLDIKCKPGVLIPRSETEAYTYHVAQLIKSNKLSVLNSTCKKRELKIVDFCTGTGCIPILLFNLLHRFFDRLHIYGVDISSRAVRLARENIAHNIAHGTIPELNLEKNLTMTRADIFRPEDISYLTSVSCDVIISNPPYISEDVWKYGRGQISYSVKKFEPRLALVPEERSDALPGWNSADIFYSRLLDIAGHIQAKVLLFEVGDEAQARRVLTNFIPNRLAATARIEVWRDWPDISCSENSEELNVVGSNGQTRTFPVVGSGNVRSVLVELSEKH